MDTKLKQFQANKLLLHRVFYILVEPSRYSSSQKVISSVPVRSTLVFPSLAESPSGNHLPGLPSGKAIGLICGRD